MADEDDKYLLPLEDQRVFGAGIMRKRVTFVPSSTTRATNPAPPASQASATVADRYLTIVLPGDGNRYAGKHEALRAEAETSADNNKSLCSVCRQPIPDFTKSASDQKSSKLHDASIAHQVCLSHSHPPSHLERDRVGLRYLSGYGWDPDNRKGLGAKADGIRIPVKAKIKNDTSGLGMHTKGRVKVKDKTPIRLNAKQLRKQEAEVKKKEAKLRELFYAPDLEHYLGPGG